MLLHETTTDVLPTVHPSGEINIINRYPEMGEGFEGFPGNTQRVIELETASHTFLSADEADALALRLIQHAIILRM